MDILEEDLSTPTWSALVYLTPLINHLSPTTLLLKTQTCPDCAALGLASQFGFPNTSKNYLHTTTLTFPSSLPSSGFP